MTKTTAGQIRVGVGGWSYELWRGTFYPEKHPQKRELEYASRQLTSIEINSTYYGSQKLETFVMWREETPDDFVFSVKAPRFATQRKVLSAAGESIERFFKSGVLALGSKLGPINWQLMPSTRFNEPDMRGFLSLLPKRVDGVDLRHALEVRNASFSEPEFIALAKEFEVAIVLAVDSDYPEIADNTSSFCYLRIMGTSEDEPDGYNTHKLSQWAQRLHALAAGEPVKALRTNGEAHTSPPLDVFAYFISGAKIRNPAAAKALLQKL